jgi:hypothetical protein
MPLSVGQPICEAAIQAAFDNAKTAGEDGEGTITEDLAKEITAAVIGLIKTATITTSVTGVTGPLAPSGTTSVTATGTSTTVE